MLRHGPGLSRRVPDPAATRRELQIIGGDLHGNAVRLQGTDIGRLTTAAADALKLGGLRVWFSPELLEKSREATLAERQRGRPPGPLEAPRRASGILPVMMIGVGLDARLGLPFDELRAAAREAEQLGFESLWTPAGGVPDSFHVCAAWSHDTSLRTGISVVPAARMWTPLGLAAQAATLAQLSSGRFVLGLGTGGYGPGFWASVGLPDRPIAVMREYVTEVRGLLAGQQVTAGPIVTRAGAGPGAPGWPRSASLGLAGLPPAPVYLAALGPQMLRLAGETADGALLNWATPERIAVSRAADRCGRRAGRPRPGRGPDDHVHPGLHRRRRGRGTAGVRRAGARLRHGPAPASRRTRATGACSPRWGSTRS